MFVLANFLSALAQVLTWAFELITWLIIIRAFLSWVNPDPSNAVVQVVYRLTEPLLMPFRLLIPSYKLGIDISPLLALLAVIFLKSFLVSTLLGLAMRLS
ncbi:MAG: YggT family protein [Candidatus Omnitrophota bacterium]